MSGSVPSIPILNLAIGFIPVIIVWYIVRAWRLPDRMVLYSNARMLLQLLLVGYVLTYIFSADRGDVVLVVLAIMLTAASWIALRPLQQKSSRMFLLVLAAIGIGGVTTLALVTQVVLDLSTWYQPHYMIPLAGMIFSNCMNTISLAAERFESERSRELEIDTARAVALNAALIPQINALLAVGIVALPGMMTGQILAGISPLIAAQYQIVVMCMIFGSAGISAACYLKYVDRLETG